MIHDKNGDPMRHTVLWEEIRTTHKLPEFPMGHVPMVTTEPWGCVVESNTE